MGRVWSRELLPPRFLYQRGYSANGRIQDGPKKDILTVPTELVSIEMSRGTLHQPPAPEFRGLAESLRINGAKQA